MCTIDTGPCSVDYSEITNLETRRACLYQINSSLHNHGYVIITKAFEKGFDIDDCYKDLKDIFAQSAHLKESVQCAFENIRYFHTKEGNSALKEFFHITRCKNNSSDKNQKLLTLASKLNHIYKNLCGLLEPLSQAVVNSLPPLKLIQHGIESDFHTLRALYYPPLPSHEQKNWAAEHSDISLFTLLPASTAPGLQFKNNQNEWVDLNCSKESVLLIVGEMLEHVTNGYYPSLKHRVICKQARSERFSLAFFVHLANSVSIAPISALMSMTGGKPLYPDLTREEFLTVRLFRHGRASDKNLALIEKNNTIEKMIKFNILSLSDLRKVLDAGYPESEPIKNFINSSIECLNVS